MGCDSQKISVTPADGITKITNFQFDITGLDGVEKKIYFGDGNSQVLDANTNSVTYMYMTDGEYTVYVTGLGNREYIRHFLTVKVNSHAYMADTVTVLEDPLTGVSSILEEDKYGFKVRLESSCDPRNNAWGVILKTDSPSEGVGSIKDKNLDDCNPVHFFYSNEELDFNEKIPNYTEEYYKFEVEDAKVITVNNVDVGFTYEFCFDYYDDYSGDMELSVTLDTPCSGEWLTNKPIFDYCYKLYSHEGTVSADGEPNTKSTIMSGDDFSFDDACYVYDGEIDVTTHLPTTEYIERIISSFITTNGIIFEYGNPGNSNYRKYDFYARYDDGVTNEIDITEDEIYMKRTYKIPDFITSRTFPSVVIEDKAKCCAECSEMTFNKVDVYRLSLGYTEDNYELDDSIRYYDGPFATDGQSDDMEFANDWYYLTVKRYPQGWLHRSSTVVLDPELIGYDAYQEWADPNSGTTEYKVPSSAGLDPWKSQSKITIPFRKLGTIKYDPDRDIDFRYLDGDVLEKFIIRTNDGINYNPREHEPEVDPNRIKWLNWAGAITNTANRELIMRNIKFIYVRTIEL